VSCKFEMYKVLNASDWLTSYDTSLEIAPTYSAGLRP